ncbi:MAG TPA: bacterial transcriptional activator domain-containing protein, partial [Candidatus Binatia bacterium]|nr:bacterial transcriptional activator domain-containing protein [Candidatus Binatia bacterium]
TREQLAEALWGNARPPADGPGFHSAISLLRRTLNRGHNVPKDFIRCERGAYLLNPAYRYDVDVEAFEHLVRSARRKSSSGDAAGALSDYAEAISLYRGPLMEGEHDDWIGAPRAYYEALRVAALVEAMDLRLEPGDAGKEAECFRAIAQRTPLDQQVSCRLMRVLGEIGDREGLDREFARLRQALADQEGVPPAPATRRVYERALKMNKTPGRSAPAARRPARGTLRRRPDGART